MMWLVGNIRLYALLQGNLCLAEPCSDKSIIKVHEHIDSSTVGGWMSIHLWFLIISAFVTWDPSLSLPLYIRDGYEQIEWGFPYYNQLGSYAESLSIITPSLDLVSLLIACPTLHLWMVLWEHGAEVSNWFSTSLMYSKIRLSKCIFSPSTKPGRTPQRILHGCWHLQKTPCQIEGRKYGNWCYSLLTFRQSKICIATKNTIIGIVYPWRPECSRT